MEQKKKQGEQTPERTTGRGAKEIMSGSDKPRTGEDLEDESSLDENLKNQLSQEDAGTGLGGDRTQRRG